MRRQIATNATLQQTLGLMRTADENMQRFGTLVPDIGTSEAWHVTNI